MATSTQDQVQIQLKGVHLCCDLCAEAVTRAVQSVPGASCAFDQESNVLLTAHDDETAQKALDAIADAGLHGETDHDRLAMKDEPGLPSGKVRKVTVSGIHNCCTPCYDAIKGAIDSVEGVQADTAAPRKTEFEVTGHFSPVELARALNAAGFHAKVTA